jgi:uncharacterized membrane protein YcaP (DUF421 family)
MITIIITMLNKVLGLDQTTLTLWHMTYRAFIVYIFGIILIRVNRKFLGMYSVANFILYVTLGSLLASAIIGSSPFFETLGIIIALMFGNWLLTLLMFHFKIIEHIVKGAPDLLVRDGKIQWRTMHHHHITKEELLDALHRNAHTSNLELVKMAYFENSGAISFVFKD